MESIKQSISFSEDKISKLRELVDRHIVELEFKNAALKNGNCWMVPVKAWLQIGSTYFVRRMDEPERLILATWHKRGWKPLIDDVFHLRNSLDKCKLEVWMKGRKKT